MLNLWKDDRPRKVAPKDIYALSPNKIIPTSRKRAFQENEMSKKPDNGGDDETFPVASTSRAPLEAEFSKSKSSGGVGNRFDSRNSKSCQNLSAVGNTTMITASFDHTDSPSSQSGHFELSYFRRLSFQEGGSLDSDSSAMPDVYC